MENNNRKALSWSVSLAIHALGAVLILVSGFHLAAPTGEVTDKVVFDAVQIPPQAPAQAPLQAPVARSQTDLPAAPAVQTQGTLPQEATQSEPAVQQDSEQSPPAEEAPSDEVANMGAPKPSLEQEEAPAMVDPTQEPDTSGSPTPIDAAQPSAAPEVGNQVTGQPSDVPGGTPALAPSPAEGPLTSVPGITLDESKLTEQFGNRKPNYPWTARLKRQQGTVMIKAFIQKEGNVEQATVYQSSGYPPLDQEAIAAYSKWRYIPGPTGWVLKPFKFSLK